MKNFLQNLLIFFSLCLCGLIAFQWVRETDLRRDVQKLTDTVHDKSEAIQSLQQTIKRDEAEIQRLDSLKNQLTETVKSNNVQMAQMTKDIEKLDAENQRNQKQVEVYKEALETANASIKKQNEDIKKQNEEMQTLSTERNEVVQKFNKMAADYNDLAKKWNDQQTELAKPPTNSPSKK